jgi:hypothetical protein
MRSGSTLLQHILDQHKDIESYSDVSSLPWIPFLKLGLGPKNVCLKPIDLFYLARNQWLYRDFDKFIWIARDPRDSYLSTIESGYAYLFWLKGEQRENVDIGLLDRWRRVYKRFFEYPDRWHLVTYEDLTTTPTPVIERMLDYLELPQQPLLPFKRYELLSGGDYKLVETKTVSNKSVGRFNHHLTPGQIGLINEYLEEEMKALGYLK